MSWNALLQNATRAAICAIAASGDDLFEQVTRETNGTAGFPGFTTPAGHFVRYFCDNPPVPPPPPGGFVGGQCPVLYDLAGGFVFNIYNPLTGQFIQAQTVAGTATITGPILQFGLVIDRGPATTNVQIRAISATQTVIVCQASAANFQFDTKAPYNVSYSLSRAGGGPDNCGNPAPPPPPTQFIRPLNITFAPVGGNSTNISGDIVVSPAIVNVTGNLEIPVAINFNDPQLNVPVSIPVSVNITTGGITIGGGGGGSGEGGGNPPPPTDTRRVPAPPPGEVVGGPPGGGPPPGSENPGGDNPPPPLPPDGAPGTDRKLIGVLTWIDDAGNKATEVFDTDSPKLFLPDIGHVVFKVSVAGSISYMEPIPIKYKRQWIPCPDPAGAVGVSVINRPNVPVRLSYVYDSRGLRSI